MLMNDHVGLKKFRNSAHRYASEVEQDKSFVVMRRAQPIFKISSPDDSEELWETVVDFTKW